MENDIRILFFNNSQQTTDNVNNLYLSQAKKHIYQGNSFLEFSNMGGAIDEFTKAITANPGYDLAYIYRGNAYFALECHENAKLDYNRALELNPDNTTAKKMLKLLKNKQYINGSNLQDVKKDDTNSTICTYVLILNYNLIPDLESASNSINNPKPTTTLIYGKFAAEYRITTKSLKSDIDGIYKYANKSCV